MSVQVRRAEARDLEPLAILFDGYRVFYEKPSDLGAAKAFLEDRFEQEDSTIFVAAREDGELVGFVQLYPTFSSTLMHRILILNDLFVSPTGRKAGVGGLLMGAAETYAREAGAARLTLSTAVDNTTAQKLYVASGYERDTAFYQYHRVL